MNTKELDAEVAKHRRGRVPRALRRRQLLAQAHGLFVEFGYSGASMDELARRVGVSKPEIFELSTRKLSGKAEASIDKAGAASL